MKVFLQLEANDSYRYISDSELPASIIADTRRSFIKLQTSAKQDS